MTVTVTPVLELPAEPASISMTSVMAAGVGGGLVVGMATVREVEAVAKESVTGGLTSNSASGVVLEVGPAGEKLMSTSGTSLMLTGLAASTVVIAAAPTSDEEVAMALPSLSSAVGICNIFEG